jgi:hypothetical protein
MKRVETARTYDCRSFVRGALLRCVSRGGADYVTMVRRNGNWREIQRLNLMGVFRSAHTAKTDGNAQAFRCLALRETTP